jgi:DNA-binding winged helix-turn-helix (wHTH) protein/tetratricopeptide (TPR) repeat protein
MVRGKGREILQFGVFELNVDSHELRKHGVRLRLHGQPFDLLRLFLERPGEVVSREEMQARLWPADTFVDFERSLNSAVKKLRGSLGDSSDHPIYIETIPRVGYRFIAPVTRNLEETATPAQPLVDQPAPAAENTAPPRSAAQRWAWISAIALLSLSAGLWFGFERRPRRALAESDRTLLAGLRNTTGDPAFDSALAQALRVKLAESPYLNLVPEPELRRALNARTPGGAARMSPDAARGVCANLGVVAVIEGTLSESNAEYEIRLAALRCPGGSLIKEVKQRASGRDELLSALGRATRELRIRLGEPEASVARFDTPIAQATTSSLAALKAFSAGEEKRALGLDYETVPDFKLAADLDPNFALAYARLGTIYQNAQEWGLARQNLEHAFAVREHASERERLYITAHYYGSITNEVDKEVQVYELWRQIYPRDVVASNNLSNVYLRTGQLDKALTSARDAVRLDPDNPFCRLSLAHALQRKGVYPEAKAIYESLVAHHNDGVNLHMLRYHIAFGEGDEREMSAQLAWAKGNPREGEMLDSAAWGAAASGQLAKARALFHKASEVGLKNGLKEYAALVLLDNAQVDADLGFAKEATAEVGEALRIAGDSSQVLASSALPLARIGAIDRAKALEAKASEAAPRDTMLQNVTLPIGRALAALSEKHPEQAVQELEIVKPYDFSTDSDLISIYYRGEALLESGQIPHAAAEFHRLLDARLDNPNSPYLELARLGLAECDRRSSDFESARARYRQFLADWKNADPELSVLYSARSAELQVNSRAAR